MEKNENPLNLGASKPPDIGGQKKKLFSKVDNLGYIFKNYSFIVIITKNHD
jgi:hypothetical protein